MVFHVAALSGRFQSSAWGWVFARLDLGVAVFFLLSGFLLYRPFVAAHLGIRDRPRLPTYVANRLLRILPAWWVALVVLWPLLGRVVVPNADEGLMWTFLLVGFQPRLFISNGLFQAWTLTIELCFYAMVPLVGWAVSLVGGAIDRRVRAQWLFLGALALCGLALRVAVNLRQPGHPALIWLPTQMDLFALGMMAALVSVLIAEGVGGRAPRAGEAAGRHPALCWVGAAVAFWILCTQLDLPRSPGLDPLSPREDLSRHLAFGVTSLLLLLPGFFGTGGRLRAQLSGRVPSVLGRISFGIYLWHVDILRYLVEPRTASAGWPFPALLGAVAVASVAAGAVSYALVERPALRLRRRW